MKPILIAMAGRVHRPILSDEILSGKREGPVPGICLRHFRGARVIIGGELGHRVETMVSGRESARVGKGSGWCRIRR